MASELSITSGTPSGDSLLLVGELDTHTAPSLASTLADVPADVDVALDLSGTTFISSAGLSAILEAQRRQEAGGGSLVVRKPGEIVARTIELSGLSEILGLS